MGCGDSSRRAIERDALLKEGRRGRERAVNRVLSAYRSEKRIPRGASPERIRRDLGIGALSLQAVPVHFVGVWDTVDAVGVPIDELKHWFDRIWRFVFKRRLWGFRDFKPHPAIRHARQALALDDERRTFHPLVWEAPNTNPPGAAGPEDLNENDASRAAEDDSARDGEQTVRQVWFAGVHSNVGGGYPKDSLSLVSLLWMMHQADACGLRFLERMRVEFREDAGPHGRLYDSRTGWGMFYRYARRDPCAGPDESPAVHESVLERSERATDYYAPKVLRPDKYVVVQNELCIERD